MKGGTLHRRADRLAIYVDKAENNKSSGHCHAQAEKKALAALRFPPQNGTKAESGRHDGNPGNDRIGDQDVGAMPGKERLLVEDVPKPGPVAELLRRKAVEKVMR